MAKREDEYELVPEGRFHYLENKVIEIFKNPIIKNTTAKDLAEALEKNNKSVDALISILRTIQADTKFEDKEQSIIKKEMHPLVLAVKEIQQQNNTLAKSMLNIIDRLNDINDTIHQIQKDIYPIPSQQESNFNPIQGGEVPPTFSTQGQTSNNTLNLNASQGTNNTNTTDSNAPPPFSLNAKPATIPEKKKGFLKK